MPGPVQRNRWFTGINICIYLTGICCLIETLCFTYLQEFTAIGSYTAVLYFLSGLCVCIFSLFFAVNAHKENSGEGAESPAFVLPVKLIAFSAFFIFIAVLLIQFGDKCFPAFPIDFRKADMLPLLRTACVRWLNHEQVYTPVKEVWGGENIPYLPGMWMPFIPSVLLDTDMRWTSIALALLSVLTMLAITGRLRPLGVVVFATVFFAGIFMIVKFYTWEDSSMFELSEEAVPLFYFTLLYVGLIYENDWLTGIMLALCTLSRFSLLPFVPFFFLWLLVNREFGRALKAAFIYAVLACVLFVFPFFMAQPGYFINIPHSYMQHVAGFWKVNNYTLQGTRNLGLAYVFGYEHQDLMRTTNYILLVAVPAVWLALFMLLKRRYRICKNIWAMGGLKLTLLVFYNFVSITSLYLFVVPTFISYPLFLAMIKEQEL